MFGTPKLSPLARRVSIESRLAGPRAATARRNGSGGLGVCIVLAVSWVLVFSAAAAGAVQVDGFTEPNSTIDLAATETGVVAELLVREGDAVTKGQLLATLDTDILQATLEISKAQMQSTGKIDAAQAEWQVGKSKLEKLRELRAKGHASQSELERAEADCAIAEARLRMAREDQAVSALECKRIEAQLERRRIRSPIDGTVLKVFKDTGEAILPGSPNVLTLVALDPLRARFSVPGEHAGKLHAGATVTVRFPETGQTANGTIEVVSPVIDAKSGTVPVVVIVPNEKGRLRSGSRCTLEVP